MPVERGTVAALAAVLVITVVAFLPALGGEFTNWDDDRYVTANPLVADASLDKIGAMIVEPVASNHHPLTILSLALDRVLFGMSPFGFHLMQLLLHLVNIVLVFLLARRLLDGHATGALLVAALFGLHPMHVESVAWISERKDVLYTLFFLASMLAYLRYLEERRSVRLCLSLGWFVLSVLSKPAAVVLPVVLLLLDTLDGRRLRDRAVILEKLPFFAIAIAMGLLTIMAQSATAISNRFDFVERVSFAAYGWCAYLAKLVVPVRLSAFYPYPVSGESLPLTVKLAPLAVLLLLGAFYLIARRNRLAWFGLLFYSVTIVLVLQFVTVGEALMAERYTYVPYIGPFLWIGWAARRVPARVVWIAAGIVVAAMALMTFERSRVWRDSESLWSDAIATHPRGAWLPFMKRGNVRFLDERFDEALADYDRAVEYAPDRAVVFFNRAQARVRLGDSAGALEDFDRSIELEPAAAEYIRNRADLRRLRGDAGGALDDYDRALALDPTDARAWSGRGAVRFTRREADRALADFTEAVRLDPELAAAWLGRGGCLGATGRHEEALAAIDRAIALRPSSLAYRNRALILDQLGRGDDAAAARRMASTLDERSRERGDSKADDSRVRGREE